jgi:predicted dehydrogenase
VIRWLVVGAGGAARAQLAALRNTPGAGVAGIVAPEGLPEDLSRAGLRGFDNLESALAQSGADAVSVATPHDTHLELGLQVLEAGLPLMVEKPVGLDTGQARALEAAAQACGGRVGVVLNQRATPAARWIRDLLRAGRLQPQAIAFSGHLARATGWNADPRRSGGGLLRLIGIHYVDLLRWWCGEPQGVLAALEGAPADDRVVAGLRYPSGLLASVQLSAVASRSLGPVRCVIEAADARIELAGHRVQRVEGLEPPPDEAPAAEGETYGPGHRVVFAEATLALVRAAPFPVPLAEALATLELVDRLATTASPGHRAGLSAR